MAHHKRGKSRAQSSPHVSRRILEARKTEIAGYGWTACWPRWHDIVFHSRPRRRLDRKVSRDVVTDRVDVDAALWAASKKPPTFYW